MLLHSAALTIRVIPENRSRRRGPMHQFSSLASVLVAIFIGLAAGPQIPLALAQEATPAVAGVVLPPEAEVDGVDLAAWSARSWQWFFSFPQDVNPLFDATG